MGNHQGHDDRMGAHDTRQRFAWSRYLSDNFAFLINLDKELIYSTDIEKNIIF
jgi:hypothetical protein